ncbi:MAG: diguanylate cyclase [Rhodobacterales bacterium]|nr:diguanylate cyclase [Rhodobacterales bacterium]
MNKLLRVASPDITVSTDQLRGLFAPLGHSPALIRHRAGAVVARARVLAGLFAALTVLGMGFDLWAFDGAVGWQIVIARGGAALAFVALAWPWPGRASPRRAALFLGLMVCVPAAFYLVSLDILGGQPLRGAAGLVTGLYMLLPFLVVAGLAVFPLTALETALYAAPMFAAILLAGLVFGGLSWPVLTGTLLLALFMAGVSALAGVAQVHYLMALVNRSVVDVLTGAYVRHSGSEIADLQFRVSARRGGAFPVACLRIDDMDSAAGRVGQAAIDRAVRDLAEALRTQLRQGDVLIRDGEGDFLVVLGRTNVDGARKVMDRVMGAGLGNWPDGAPLTVSAGVAERMTDRAEDWATLSRAAADRAAKARAQGGNRAVLWDGAVLEGAA